EASMMQMAETRRKTKASAHARMEQVEQDRERRELGEDIQETSEEMEIGDFSAEQREGRPPMTLEQMQQARAHLLEAA
ncbi:hypothetical protein DUNSADRAFT_12745, partial [Dunaliella salina]